MAEAQPGDPGLTTDQLLTFHDQGYLGPFRACPAVEVAEYARRIKNEVLSGDDYPLSDAGINPQRDRHRDSPALYELLTCEAVTGRIADVFGPDLMLWASHIWEKEPGALEVPWHQDMPFQGLEPTNNVTAWLALSPVDRENGCLEFAPGSHKNVVPHVEAPEDVLDDRMADPEAFDREETAVMEMEPGEFVLFNERLVHRSSENTADRPRVALVGRFAPTFVTIDGSHERIYDGHRPVLASGEDTHGLNDFAPPPA